MLNRRRDLKWLGVCVAVLALGVSVLAGAEEMSRKELRELVLTLDDVKWTLDQDEWVVRVPVGSLFKEPEGSITARAIYGNPSTNRLLLVVLYHFDTEDRAQAFYATPPEGGEQAQTEATQLAVDALTLESSDETTAADEVKIAVNEQEQSRFLRFRWGRFVAQLEIDVARVSSPRDVTDENLIKLAKRQFELLVRGR